MARSYLNFGQSEHHSENGKRKLLGISLHVLSRSLSTGHFRHHRPGLTDEKSGFGDPVFFEDLESGRQQREEEIFLKKMLNGDGRRAVSSRFPESNIYAELASYGRPHFLKETKKETLSSVSEIVEDEENFDANATPLLPETKSSAPLLPETESSTSLLPHDTSNHEAYHTKDDSSQRVAMEVPMGSNTGENDPNSRIGSPASTEYFSCPDVDQRTDNCNKVTFKWILVIGNFICELVSAIFDQLSSPHNSLFALIAMVASFVATIFCLMEIVCKCPREKVTWRARGKICWFRNPSHKHFGSFKDIFGLVCGTLQFISVAICYAFYHQHRNCPIKLSLCAVIFAFCLMCSKLGSLQDKVDRD